MRPTTLVKTAAAALLTATVGGLASGPAAQSGWYERLTKPRFQPPRQVFPIVWPILYADIAAVSASTIDLYGEQNQPQQRRAYAIALGVNLATNAGWTWLFFNRRRLGASAVAAVVLTASSVDLTRRAVDARGWAAVPLVLYPLWCGFATLLSSRIWWLNRGGS